MKRLLPPFALLSLVFALALPARADLADIVPNGFSRASAMTVNDYAGTAPLTNFPVLVKIAAGDPVGFRYSDLMFPSTGADLGFVDMEGNGLPFEIDEWNTNGTSVLWVNVPSVANGTNFVMVYRSARTGKSLNGANPFADYVGVWHLGETNAASTTIYDSTDNHLDGISGANSARLDAGAIGGARYIHNNDNNNGSDYCINVQLGAANTAKHDVVDSLVPEFTASFWWRHPKNFKTRWNQLIGRKLNPNDPTWHLVFDLNSTTRNQLRVYSAGTDGNAHYQAPKSPQTTCEKWYKIDLVYYIEVANNVTNGRYRIYFDGDGSNFKDDYTFNKAPAANGDGHFYIGGSGGSRPYLGWMDEVRLRKFIPTADWVKAEYDQATDESFISKAEVVRFEELPKPVISATRGDFGAAFVQFSGSVSQLGGDATSCDIYAKVWPEGGTEPATGVLLASSLGADGSFADATVTGLSPQIDYQWEVYAVNNLTPTAYESDPVAGTFTTAGVGGAGTGGAVSRVVDDYVHIFEIAIDGTQTYEFMPPTGVTNVEALIVGGGGPGGFYAGGGGGAGGLVHDTALALSGGTTYTVTVGTGGVPASSTGEYGTNGGDSLITSGGGATTNAIAHGGGAGGNGPLNGQTTTVAGKSGGSGGGSTRSNASGGSGTNGQGSNGGTGLSGGGNGYKMESGGGGGAGGSGGSGSHGSTEFPGPGGTGIRVDITGTPTYYAGGGSGGGEEYNNNNNRAYPVPGGNGGGGRGGMKSDIDGDEIPTAGMDGLGGGGGGGSTVTGYEKGGNGGSGIVVIRYPATGSGAGALEPAVSLSDLVYDSSTGWASVSFRVAWAGADFDRADVAVVWGFSPDVLDHTNAIAAAAIGRGSGSFQFPDDNRMVYVRALATNGAGYSAVSPEVRTIVLSDATSPIVSIASVEAEFTNALFAVEVGSLGAGATGAETWIEVCTNAAFTADVLAFPRAALATEGMTNLAAWGLAAGTQHWARAVASNSLGRTTWSEPVAFETQEPGFAEGSAVLDIIGFTTIAASVTVSSFGPGSTSAAVRLEASADDDFATLAAVTEWTNATLSAAMPFELSELSHATSYSLRACISNAWGLVAYVPIPAARTRTIPIATSGISYAFSLDGTTLDIAFGVTTVFDGASCQAKLYYGASPDPSQSVNPEKRFGPEDAFPFALRWEDIEASPGTMYAKVVVDATINGVRYTQSWTVKVVHGANSIVVTDFADYASAAKAILVRPGDIISLPEIVGEDFYEVGNHLFASLEGTTVTALRPGIVGIHRRGDDGSGTNGVTRSTLPVLVLPEAIGSGDIFILKEAALANNTGIWSNPAIWDRIGSEENDSYPNGPDDIAIIPLYNKTSGSVTINGDAVVGSLYFGGYCDGRAAMEIKGSSPGTLSLRREDDRTARVQLCSNSTYLGNNTYRTELTFHSTLSVLTFDSDTVLSGGWDGTNPNYPQGRFKFSDKTNVLSGGVTVTLREMDTQGQSMGYTLWIGNLAGGGTFWNRSSAMVRVGGDSGAFTGILRDSGGINAGTTDRTGPMFIRTVTTTNCTGEIVGWVARTGGEPSDDFTRSIGCFQTGGTHSYQVPDPHDPWFTKKGFSMHGGMFRIGSDSRTDWPWPDKRLTDFFSVGGGFNYFHGYNNSSTLSIAWFEADEVRHEGTATLRIRDQSVFHETATNMVTILHGIAEHAVGAGGNPRTSNASSIVPWIVAQAGEKNSEDLRFAAFDENDRLSKIVNVKGRSLSEHGPTDNAYVFDAGIALDTDAICNSLALYNDRRDKLLGEGRTLTLTSGGLILGDIDWNATTTSAAIGQETGGSANGFLVLGDADHPGYVWARGQDSDNVKYAPNEIWAEVSAPGGFVSAHTGTLVLGGNQTNILEEIVVNAGTLQLGTTNSACSLRRNLPIRIFANAVLRIPNAGSTEKNILQYDGAAGWFGKVELPEGVAAQAKRAYWRDFPETPDWQSIPRGTYTGDEDVAAALDCTYDPEHFVGAGTIRIVQDDCILPTLMILR